MPGMAKAAAKRRTAMTKKMRKTANALGRDDDDDDDDDDDLDDLYCSS